MSARCVFVLGLILANLVTGGCSMTGAGDPNIRHYEQDTISTERSRARLVLGSSTLTGRIAIVDVRIGTAGRLQKAEVSVQNMTNDRYTLEYMYSWEDQQGFSITDNRVWKRFVLGPREIRGFQSVASNPDAYALTMTVRLPDDLFIHQEKTTR